MKLLDAGPSEAGWHRIQSIKRCLRYYALEREQTKREWTDALVNGSLVHVGLAHWYKHRQAKLQGIPNEYYTPEEAIKQLALKETEKGGDKLWLQHVELASYMVNQYMAHYHAETLRPLHIEEQFRGKMGEHLYTQRADLIVADADDKVWIIDHKTTYRVSAKVTKRYTLSGQFLGYQVIGKKVFAERFGGVLLNMIQRPTLKQYHENPTLPIDFKRVATEPAPYALKTFKQTILDAEQQLKNYSHLDNAMDWPGTYSETACMTAYGPCPFHTTCQFGF
jgi:hypothetical protein